MASRSKRRIKGRRQKVIPVKIRKEGTVLTEKPKSDPFVPLFAHDLYDSWHTAMKQMMANSLDTNEKLAKEALTWYKKATAWAKETPWEPLCKTFSAAASK